MNRTVLRRGATVLSAATVLAIWIYGCHPAQKPAENPPSTATEVPPPPDACSATGSVELLLADLVPTAAVGYGTLSPFLYEVDDKGGIHIATGAVVKDKPAAAKATELLELVNRNKAAQATFAKNIESSQHACLAAQCPRDKAYPVRELERPPGSTDWKREVVSYSFGDGVLTEAEEKPFLLLLQSGGGSCPPAVEARFEGNRLLVRAKRGCPADDCHAATDSHATPGCCTKHTISGTWQPFSSSLGDMHCCE